MTSSITTPLHTTGRYYGESPGMRLVRLALGTAQRLWPALAVRAAYRVFGTPLPLRKPGRRGADRLATVRPVTRSTAAITSLTDEGCSVPTL